MAPSTGSLAVDGTDYVDRKCHIPKLPDKVKSLELVVCRYPREIE
ncbi:MAG: hypothetical protein ACLP72_06785 [Candidatus Sulfotelmatobacter sp.]